MNYTIIGVYTDSYNQPFAFFAEAPTAQEAVAQALVRASREGDIPLEEMQVVAVIAGDHQCLDAPWGEAEWDAIRARMAEAAVTREEAPQAEAGTGLMTFHGLGVGFEEITLHVDHVAGFPRTARGWCVFCEGDYDAERMRRFFHLNPWAETCPVCAGQPS
jgi:hypothetical protein